MLFTFPVMHEGLGAITHVDGSARVQTVEKGTLHSVLTEIDKTGAVPVLINTSYNVAGEPIVETSEQAVNCFLKLGFDYLFIDGRIYEPSETKEAEPEVFHF